MKSSGFFHVRDIQANAGFDGCIPDTTKKQTAAAICFFSLGYKDSNLEMTESESVALPFGDTPLWNFAVTD